MDLRPVAAAIFVVVAGLPASGQARTVSVCVVETKADAHAQFDPPAGRYAAGMFNELSRHRLQDGAELKLIPLAASLEKDVAPEVRRLGCSWVVELWFHARDNTGEMAGPSMSSDVGGGEDDPIVQNAEPATLIFALWNARTRKVVARGAAPPPVRQSAQWRTLPFNPYPRFARAILKKLRQKY